MEMRQVVVGEGTKYPLNGVITVPKGVEGLVPGVVFVHGSGSNNMDEKVGALAPFRDLAEGLARRGVASIRYDKRSFTHGLAMVRDKSATLTVEEETIEDAVLAAELLREDPRVDPSRVFIVGHSMGAMLAPRIDAEGGDFRGLVLLAGTPRKLEEVMIEQNEEAAAQMRGPARWLVSAQSKKLKKLFAGLYDLSDEEAKRKKVGGGTTLYYFKEMGEHSAPAYLADSRKPMLIMQGGKDCQVKVDEDFGAYRNLLQGRSNVTFKPYESLNHCFVPAIHEGIMNAKKDYAVERHIGDDVIADIANWIKGV